MTVPLSIISSAIIVVICMIVYMHKPIDEIAMPIIAAVADILFILSMCVTISARHNVGQDYHQMAYIQRIYPKLPVKKHKQHLTSSVSRDNAKLRKPHTKTQALEKYHKVSKNLKHNKKLQKQWWLYL